MANKKTLYFVITIIILLFATLVTLRIFSGEDSWMCQDGEWIEHGHPSYPQPLTDCK